MSFKHRDTGKATTRVVPSNLTIDEAFEFWESKVDDWVVTSTSRSGAPRRDVRALSALYLLHLRALNRDDKYISGRKSILNKWVIAHIGDVLVADWSPGHSLQVLNAATRAGLSRSRTDDVLSTLSGLRQQAQTRRPGGRWLERSENPLEGIRSERVRRTGRRSVPLAMRPATESVLDAVDAARRVGRWDWLGTCVEVAGFCGLRRAEQLALRAVDVWFDDESLTLDVNGRWKPGPGPAARGQRAARGHRQPGTKSGWCRVVPVRWSMRDELVRLCASAMRLPADTDTAAVATAIATERERRAGTVSGGDWRDAAIDPADELWLFPSKDGLPPGADAFARAWRQVRDESGWPVTIPFKNLRHHACLWLKKHVRTADDRELAWADIAPWMGHTPRTLQSYYEVPEDNALHLAWHALRGL